MSTWECLSPVDKNQFPICWKHSFVSWTGTLTTDRESCGNRDIDITKSMKKDRLARDRLKINVGDGSGACVKWAWPMFNVTRAPLLITGRRHREDFTATGRHGAQPGTRHSQAPELGVTALLQINIHCQVQRKWPVSSWNFCIQGILHKNDSFIGACLPTGFIIFVR